MDLREQLELTLADAYSLERELGGGGMSRVFVATEKASDRRRDGSLPVRQPGVLGGMQEPLVRRHQGESHHLRGRGDEAVHWILMRERELTTRDGLSRSRPVTPATTTVAAA